MFVLIAVANVAYILQAGLVHGQGFTSCIYNFNCTAVTNLGLITLNRATTENPYQTTNPVTSAVYYWKPCDDFTLSGLTAGAIEQTFGSYAVDIGNHNQAFCDISNGFIRFNMMSADYNRFTYVRCICGTGDTFRFDSESPFNNFNFIFTSNACCANSGTTSTSKSPSNTTTSPYTPAINHGTTMVIIIASLLAALLLCGTLFVVIVSKSLKRRRNTYIAI